VTFGQRFARLVTTVVVRVPFLWRFFRRRLTRNFDRLAPEWDATRVSRGRLAPMVAALESLPDPPGRALDVGTGTGAVARLLSELWPEAEVVGVDASSGMIAEARRLGRERYELGDATALPFDDASFDLVTLNNMIPFFGELARVTRPGGVVVIAFSMGDRTPIWVPLRTVRAGLERRGFAHVADFSAGPGLALLARKDEVS
jgi:ubiquinone/menaquinone biosynthesis C-methylase UbiE